MKKYVEEYKGHKVPKGATSFGRKSEFYPQDSFYRKNGSEVFVINGWLRTVSKRGDLIELPEAAKEAEWEPTVGEKCRIAESTEWLKISHEPGMIVKIYPSFVADSGATLFPFLSVGLNKVGGVATAECFCPLKSVKELEHEAFIERGLESYMNSEAAIEDPDLARLLDKLFDDGFTAPTE
jgi:hypothetical protein